MAGKVKVWFDSEADFLEVQFSDALGVMQETGHDAVMERASAEHRFKRGVGLYFPLPANPFRKY